MRLYIQDVLKENYLTSKLIENIILTNKKEPQFFQFRKGNDIFFINVLKILLTLLIHNVEHFFYQSQYDTTSPFTRQVINHK